MSTRSSGPSGQTMLVGRSRELETFRSALRAVTAGTPSVIQVTGEIGIGRTRLLQAFAALADAENVDWLLTRTTGQDEEPLGPLRHGERSAPLPTLTRALADPPAGKDHFGELIHALARDARSRPLCLLIDDLHAADEATRLFAERLIAAIYHGTLRSSRVAVVLSLRSGSEAQELRDRLDLHDRRGVVGRLTLERFGAGEIRHWLEAHYAAVPDEELVRLLGEASGGNPLLVYELNVFLERSGFLRHANGRVCVDAGSGKIALPRDLTSLLQGKIRSISNACRHAITLAAFLGNEFDSLALADLMNQNGTILDALIDEAAGASLLERRGGCQVGFKHAAARELFYAAPDRRSREDTHRHICEGLIGEFGEAADEHCLAITHHLLRSGRRADPALLLRYAPQAAEVAFRHHSYYLAGRYFEAAALAARDSLPTVRQAELHTRAGEAFQRWSDGARSNSCFEEAVRLYRQCDDLAGHARALQGLLRNLIAFGEAGDEASAAAGQLQGLLGSLPERDVELRVRVHDTLAAHYHHIARYDIAETYAQTAMTVARNSGDPTLRCIPVTSLALAQMDQLRLTDAKTTWLEGLSYDRAAGEPRYEGLHLQRLPVPLYCMGEVQEAARYNQASYQHNEAIGNTGELCLNLTVDVMIANLKGDFETAIDTGREAMELMASTRYFWSAPSLIGALAYALTMRERFDEAQAVIDHLAISGLTFADTGPYRSTAARLTQLVGAHRGSAGMEPAQRRQSDRRQGIRGVRVGSLGRLCSEGELALLQQRPERLSGVHDALEYVHRRGIALSLGWCCSVPRSLAASTALRGGRARAAAYFAEASKLAERINAPLEQGRVALYRGLVALWCDGVDFDDARRDLTESLDCFQRFDAPALARLAADALSRTAAHPNTH